MWWLRGMAIAVAGLSLVAWGCGDDSFGGTDQGTLQLMRFAPGAEDQPEHASSRGAECDTHTELARTLLDGIGDDTEDADHREHECEGCKRHHHDGAESGARRCLSRHVIEAHGGQITLESPPEGGTCVWFTVPGVEE